jgi:hypothetical protein
MPDLDQELLERVARWCAEAGRTTVPAEIHRALEPLGWDELLAVRALLADPPPARPLGPFALADLARGVSPETAAEQERSGHYASPDDAGDGPQEQPEAAAAPVPVTPRKAGGKRGPKSQGPVIRRARDAAPPVPPTSPSIPLADELLLPEGRTVLERLVRHHGARRHGILAALAEGWRTADGGPIDDPFLDRLLDLHGLARAFASRERDELLHALRASGGLRSAAASRLGVDRDALDAALTRLDAGVEAEKIRDARRGEVRAKATLAERVKLLLTEAARLEDLGILGEVEDDLRRRLPEHVRAVGAGGGPLLVALGNSLSIGAPEAQALLERLGVTADLGPPRAREGAGAQGQRARTRPGFGSEGAPGGGLRAPRRPVTGRSGPGQRPPRRGPPAAGTFGPPRDRRERMEGGFGPPRGRGDRPEGKTFGPPRQRRDRPEGGGFGPPRGRSDRPERKTFGPPRQRRDRPEGGGFGPPRGRSDRPERKTFGPPRQRRDRPEGGGFGPPRGRGDRPEGKTFGPPRQRRDRPEGGGFGPPRGRGDRPEGKRFGPPRDRGDRPEGGGFGPPRGRGDRPEGKRFGPPRDRAPGARGSGPRTGAGGPGGARTGRPGPRPGGPRGKPTRPGPRRA